MAFFARIVAPAAVSITLTGRITQIVRGRACGFIRAADGQDVFFHASDLLDTTFQEIKERLAVRFTLVRDDISGPRAVRVQLDRARSGKDLVESRAARAERP